MSSGGLKTGDSLALVHRTSHCKFMATRIAEQGCSQRFGGHALPLPRPFARGWPIPAVVRRWTCRTQRGGTTLCIAGQLIGSCLAPLPMIHSGGHDCCMSQWRWKNFSDPLVCVLINPAGAVRVRHIFAKAATDPTA